MTILIVIVKIMVMIMVSNIYIYIICNNPIILNQFDTYFKESVYNKFFLYSLKMLFLHNSDRKHLNRLYYFIIIKLISVNCSI